MSNRLNYKLLSVLLVALILPVLLLPCFVKPRKASAVSKVTTFDMLYSGVWASTFYPDSTTGYGNSIVPIRLYFDFYGGNGSDYSSFVTVRGSFYSTGGKNEFIFDAFTYSNTWSDLRTDTYSGGLLPDYNITTSGFYTYNDSGWFTLTKTTLNNEMFCPMRIYFTSTFLTSSDDYITSMRMVKAYSEELTGAYRIINRLYFYSLTGTCFVDFMQYFPDNSGPDFNSFSDNTFYFDDYVDYISVSKYNEGYEEGYYTGFDNGFEEGAEQGYDLGYADGSSDKISAGDFMERVFDILDVKIFGVFSISDLLIMLVGTWLVLMALKIFAGG